MILLIIEKTHSTLACTSGLMTWLINNNFDLYPSTNIKEKLALSNNITYEQLDWFFKRIRKKKRTLKLRFMTFHLKKTRFSGFM